MIRSGVVLAFCLALFVSPAPTLAAEEALKLAILPYIAASALHTKFTPLVEYLSHEIGQNIVIEVSQSYDSHIDTVGRGKADIAYMGPAPYIILKKRYGVGAILAGLEIRGKRTFHGVIITRSDCDCTSLQDLAGKKFAFGNVNSTMAHLVPRYMLLQAGNGGVKLAGYDFLANHDNVALGVLMGDFHAGAVKEETFQKYRHRGLQMLTTTPEIAAQLFVADKKLPAATISKIRQAMYRLHKSEAGRKILTAIKKDATGLVPAADHEFDNHRHIIESLIGRGILP